MLALLQPLFSGLWLVLCLALHLFPLVSAYELLRCAGRGQTDLAVLLDDTSGTRNALHITALFSLMELTMTIGFSST